MLTWLIACAPDYGVKYTVVEEVIENVTEVAGEIGVEQGYAGVDSADVLLVVDRSGSMTQGAGSSELARVIDAALDITSALQSTGLDWQMDQHDDYNERLLSATLAHLTGSTWHRADASLLVVLISDEDDAGGMVDAASYLASVAAYKAAPATVYTSAIVYRDESEALSCGTSIDSAGLEYIAASSQVVTLCGTEDYSLVLTDIVAASVVGQTVWQLRSGRPALPYEDHITVLLDAVETQAWTYDHVTNAVVLDAPPPADTWVTVVYILEP